MKMSRSGILTSGRRPSRPDGMYYRDARKLRSGGGRRRGKSGMIVAVLLVLIAVVAYVWVL